MDRAHGEARTLILCEGKEDEAFLNWIIDFAGIQGLVIRGVGGKDASTASFQAFVQDPVFGAAPELVAVVFDSDENPSETRESIQRRLNQSAPSSRHRIYLFPDDEAEGELEDLCLAACCDSVRLQCAESLVTCLETNGYQEFKRSKLKLLAYIAATKLERRSIEYAAKDGQFDPHHPLVQKLASFVTSCAAAE